MTRPSRQQRQRAERLGHLGEWLAILALMLKGYAILARRARTGAGEIDLIVRRGRLIAFVEVKARPSGNKAIEAVSPHARRRICRAAEIWVSRRPKLRDHDWRFDIVAIVPYRWPQHIADAWRPDFAPS